MKDHNASNCWLHRRHNSYRQLRLYNLNLSLVSYRLCLHILYRRCPTILGVYGLLVSAVGLHRMLATHHTTSTLYGRLVVGVRCLEVSAGSIVPGDLQDVTRPARVDVFTKSRSSCVSRLALKDKPYGTHRISMRPSDVIARPFYL